MATSDFSARVSRDTRAVGSSSQSMRSSASRVARSQARQSMNMPPNGPRRR